MVDAARNKHAGKLTPTPVSEEILQQHEDAIIGARVQAVMKRGIAISILTRGSKDARHEEDLHHLTNTTFVHPRGRQKTQASLHTSAAGELTRAQLGHAQSKGGLGAVRLFCRRREPSQEASAR
jgi:hypothetical protein